MKREPPDVNQRLQITVTSLKGTPSPRECHMEATDHLQSTQQNRLTDKYSSEEEFQFWKAFAANGLLDFEKRAIANYVQADACVLDVGCGCGREAAALVGAAAWPVPARRGVGAGPVFEPVDCAWTWASLLPVVWCGWDWFVIAPALTELRRGRSAPRG